MIAHYNKSCSLKREKIQSIVLFCFGFFCCLICFYNVHVNYVTAKHQIKHHDYNFGSLYIKNKLIKFYCEIK